MTLKRYSIPLYITSLRTMSENDIKQMQDKIDEAIRKAQEKLVEKVRQQDGKLIVTRDGKLMAIGANEV